MQQLLLHPQLKDAATGSWLALSLCCCCFCWRGCYQLQQALQDTALPYCLFKLGLQLQTQHRQRKRVAKQLQVTCTSAGNRLVGGVMVCTAWSLPPYCSGCWVEQQQHSLCEKVNHTCSILNADNVAAYFFFAKCSRISAYTEGCSVVTE